MHHMYRGVVLTPNPHLQCRGLKFGRAIPLPALRALVARKGGTFTFTFFTSPTVLLHSNYTQFYLSIISNKKCD
jgi:hypothetical protein